MKSLLDPKSNRGLFSGPLSAHVGAYLAQLESQGYKRPTLYPDALLLADLDAWMKRDGRLVKDLSQPLLDRFLVHHMRKRRSRRRPKRLALQRLLMMLRTAGAVEPESPPPGTPAGNLVPGVCSIPETRSRIRRYHGDWILPDSAAAARPCVRQQTDERWHVERNGGAPVYPLPCPASRSSSPGR